jgi:hypothetical protein
MSQFLRPVITIERLYFVLLHSGGSLLFLEERDTHMLRPLSSFVGLHRIAKFDSWLADPTVMGECVWERVGSDGRRYAFYVLRNDGPTALGALLRDDCWHYGRFHADEVLAARDGSAWALEIATDADTHELVYGGFDRRRRHWSVRVVRRPERWELLIADGGVIPNVSEFPKLDDAELAADAWLTEFHERES